MSGCKYALGAMNKERAALAEVCMTWQKMCSTIILYWEDYMAYDK